MSRYLFVVPPFFSHVQPTIAVGCELERRGHAAAWVGYSPLRHVLPVDAAFHPIPSSLSESAIQELRRESGAPWFAGVKVLFERVLSPMALDMLPGVEAAIAKFAPDLLIVDQQTWAGALAARRSGMPWATSAPTAALYDDSFRQFPKVAAWVHELYSSMQSTAGVAPVPWPDLSPSLVLLYTSRRFIGGDRRFPPHFRFVGPALENRPENVEFPWHELRSGRRVFVSLGTQFALRGEKFFRTTVEALEDIPEQVIMHVPAQITLRAPANFIIRPWVPLLRLLPMIDAIVSHAGTTVMEGLAHGLPAVVAPVTQDQFIFARCAVDAGAARRVSFGRVLPAQLRESVRAVLDEPSYSDAAREVRESFREAGGVAAAAAAIEQLA
jgi:MGT family glycosyltransferase